jgi:hypothetical protein
MHHSLLPDAMRSPHNGAILLVLVLLIAGAPLSSGNESALVVELLFDLVMVTAAYSAAARGGHVKYFLALTGLTVAWRWGALLAGHGDVELGAMAVTVVWITFASAIVVKALFVQREVDTNMIFGAVVAYLLVAVAFAYVFEILETLQPGSFAGVPDGGHPRAQGNALIYFSLVCLTTMGYGDILPVSDLSRPLAVLEGVFGTLYLAVMVARLVGIHSRGERSGQEA